MQWILAGKINQGRLARSMDQAWQTFSRGWRARTRSMASGIRQNRKVGVRSAYAFMRGVEVSCADRLCWFLRASSSYGLLAADHITSRCLSAMHWLTDNPTQIPPHHKNPTLASIK